MSKASDLLTSTEAGQILRCSGRTVLRRMAKGEIEAVGQLPGPNGSFLFKRGDVERLAAKNHKHAEKGGEAA